MSEIPNNPKLDNRSTPISVWVLAAFGLTLRLGVIITLAGLWKPPNPGSDSKEYDTYAWNLAQGRGYRGMSIDVKDQDHLTAYRPPTTPMFYAAVYLIFGHSYPAAHCLDSLMAALTIVLIFRIGDISFGRGVAWISSLAYTFYPMALFYNVDLLSETSAAFLLTTFCLSFIRLDTSGSPRWILATGLSLGLLLLCKPGLILACPFLLLTALWLYRRDWFAWRRLACVTLLAGTIMAPWVIRNALVFHKFIPFSNLGGQALLISYNRLIVEDPDLYGYCVQDTVIPEYAAILTIMDDEYLRDQAAKQLAMEWIRDNLDKIPYLVRWRFVRYWLPWGTGGGLLQRLVVYVPYGLALIFFIIALPSAARHLIRRRDPALVLVAILLGGVASALVFFGQHRYRFPTDWILILFASQGLINCIYAIRLGHVRPLRARFGPTSAVSAILLLIIIITWIIDDRRIESYRDQVCHDRRSAIIAAIKNFQTTHRRKPDSLTELVPEYLPNVQALHCPKHSLGWAKYHHLIEVDAQKVRESVSYTIKPPDLPGGQSFLLESEDRHNGRLALTPIP